jgi:adenylate kinase
MEGFPRTVEQAELFDVFLKEKDSNLDFVLNLTIGSDTVNSRVLNRHQCKYCGSIVDCSDILVNNSCPVCNKQDAYRADDTKDSLEKRLELFQKKSFPLITFYSSKKLLWNIDASGTIDHVFQSINSLLISITKGHTNS